MVNVNELITQVLGIPQESLKDHLRFGWIQQWDSIGHVNLMLALESALGVEIDEDTMVGLTSVEAIREFATAHSKARA
jgi:citrate synthase